MTLNPKNGIGINPEKKLSLALLVKSAGRGNEKDFLISFDPDQSSGTGNGPDIGMFQESSVTESGIGSCEFEYSGDGGGGLGCPV